MYYLLALLQLYGPDDAVLEMCFSSYRLSSLVTTEFNSDTSELPPLLTCSYRAFLIGLIVLALYMTL